MNQEHFVDGNANVEQTGSLSIRGRLAAGILAVGLAVSGGFYEGDSPVQGGDCSGFTRTILDPPSGDEYGPSGFDGSFAPNLKPGSDSWRETQYDDDASPVVGTYSYVGSVLNKNGNLTATGNLPSGYAQEIKRLLDESPANRWGVCRLTGGVVINTVSNPLLDNAHFAVPGTQQGDTVVPGNGAIVFEIPEMKKETVNEFATTVTHEEGHFIRYEIEQGGANPEAVALVNQMDELYRQHIGLAVEVYRQAHMSQLVDMLQELHAEAKNSDDAAVTDHVKQEIETVVDQVLEQVQKPGGLSELATVRDEGVTYYTGLSGMFTETAKKLGFSDFANVLGGATVPLNKFLAVVDAQGLVKGMDQYITNTFVTDAALLTDAEPRDGHPWGSSDELWATMYNLTGYISANKYTDLIEKAIKPVQFETIAQEELFKSIAEKELNTMQQVRLNFGPDDFGVR